MKREFSLSERCESLSIREPRRRLWERSRMSNEGRAYEQEEDEGELLDEAELVDTPALEVDKSIWCSPGSRTTNVSSEVASSTRSCAV